LKAQTDIVLFNVPASFEPELAKLRDAKIIRNPKKPASVQFALAFTQRQAELAIRGAGFDSVRQVAIDEDWSALRFRRLEYINGSVR
jgi:hypothetical protein